MIQASSGYVKPARRILSTIATVTFGGRGRRGISFSFRSRQRTRRCLWYTSPRYFAHREIRCIALRDLAWTMGYLTLRCHMFTPYLRFSFALCRVIQYQRLLDTQAQKLSCCRLHCCTCVDLHADYNVYLAAYRTEALRCVAGHRIAPHRVERSRCAESTVAR